MQTPGGQLRGSGSREVVVGGVGLSFLPFSALLHPRRLLKTQSSPREGLQAFGQAAGVGCVGGGCGGILASEPLGVCWSLGKKDPGGVAARRCWLRESRAEAVEEQMPLPCTPRLGPLFSSPPCPTSRITFSDALGSASANPCNHQVSVQVSAFVKVQGPRLLNFLPHFFLSASRVVS